MRAAIAIARPAPERSAEELLDALKRSLKTSSREPKLNREALKALLTLTERGLLAEEQLRHMQHSLTYLIEGCSYPRAIRHTLRAIRSGTFKPPAPVTLHTPARILE